MYIDPKSETTKLRTSLTFRVLDYRGRGGFPKGPLGLVFSHHEKRNIRCCVTGTPIKRDALYTIRTADGEDGWRIDRVPARGPAETVYGIGQGRPTHWATNQGAAAALEAVLNEIRDHSSLGSR